MKATELRIGNWVETKTGKFQVGIIDPSFNNWDEIQPIPLTEEWLLKFGFERVEGWDDMHFWIIPDEINNSDRFELLETGKGYEMNSGSICHYVHTLQNCYYFHYLSGKELTITE